eukprot:m.243227 g.243227  ORF g.243227 m.243227 type:complete len:358 (-) comp27182_c0_seq1:21-1094(-)
MSGREIATVQLPPGQRARLARAGFRTVEDVIALGPVDLAKELEISNEEALEILDVVKGAKPGAENPPTQSSSALEMLKQERVQAGIITFCGAWDGMLGNGIPLGKLTEVCGPPGIGKTQLGIQLAVDVQIPQCFSGVEGEAIYIDTEGSFVAERARDIAAGVLQHLQTVSAQPNNAEHAQACAELSLAGMLSRIHLFRAHTHHELIALSFLLEDFCKEHPNVRLVVVDSIAFHFRQEFASMALRSRLLHGIAQTLIRLAVSHNLAVVLTNQMTTKLGGESRGQLVPALGESWGHMCTNRIVLSWQRGVRCATLAKSPTLPETTINYDVTPAGIRDVWVADLAPADGPAVKRTRGDAV